MDVRFGTDVLEFPSAELGELTPTPPAALAEILRNTLARDGYLFLPGLLDRETVLESRATIMHHLADADALVPGEPVLHGVMPKGGKGVRLMGYTGITHTPPVLATLESPALFSFFEQLFGEPATTYDYKWLRAVGNERFTGSHYDIVYMGRGSKRVHTVWIPFGDVPVEHGTLAICRGSHVDDGFARIRATYGRMDVDRDRISGWFSDSPQEITRSFGGRWLTASVRAGDALVFGMYTMHASTTNTTDRFRLSCDVRFQPASEPADERWIGADPPGHDGLESPGTEPMASARQRWGL